MYSLLDPNQIIVVTYDWQSPLGNQSDDWQIILANLAGECYRIVGNLDGE